MRYFVNISAHPTNKWNEKQLNAAKHYKNPNGDNEIVDIPFPNVPPTANEFEVRLIAHRIGCEVVDKTPNASYTAVHIGGELTLCVELAVSLPNPDIDVICSTTERISTETIVDGKTVKTVEFDFVQFRKLF